jgi:hypothetical protein
MQALKRLSNASNEFLEEIHKQLDPFSQRLFSKLLTSLDKPSPSEQTFQAILSELPEHEIEDLLSDAIDNGLLEKEQLDACHEAYPSIITEEVYTNLLSHFEE